MVREIILLVALAAAVFAGFLWLDLSPDAERFRLSEKNEERLGRLLVDSVLIERKEVTSIPVIQSVAAITDRLLDALPEGEYRYRVLVVASPEANAVTFPGGNIIVFSGLIEMTDSPEELAAVLAHEIGHVEQRHVVKKLAKNLGLELLITAAGGGDQGLLKELVKEAMSVAFDRHQEQEADEFALDLLLKAKIDPRVMASFFRKVDERQTDLEKKLMWISDHPENRARIRSALQFRVPPGAVFEPFEIDWKAVKASLDGAPPAGEEAADAGADAA
jgi:predicted Zn-dependent protease